MVVFVLVVLVAFFSVLAFSELDFVAELVVVFFVLALVVLDFETVLVALDFPGKALQCALVFLPFLSTDDFLHVQVLLDEHAELLNPLH